MNLVNIVKEYKTGSRDNTNDPYFYYDPLFSESGEIEHLGRHSNNEGLKRIN